MAAGMDEGNAWHSAQLLYLCFCIWSRYYLTCECPQWCVFLCVFYADFASALGAIYCVFGFAHFQIFWGQTHRNSSKSRVARAKRRHLVEWLGVLLTFLGHLASMFFFSICWRSEHNFVPQKFVYKSTFLLRELFFDSGSLALRSHSCLHPSISQLDSLHTTLRMRNVSESSRMRSAFGEFLCKMYIHFGANYWVNRLHLST